MSCVPRIRAHSAGCSKVKHKNRHVCTRKCLISKIFLFFMQIFLFCRVLYFFYGIYLYFFCEDFCFYWTPSERPACTEKIKNDCKMRKKRKICCVRSVFCHIYLRVWHVFYIFGPDQKRMPWTIRLKESTGQPHALSAVTRSIMGGQTGNSAAKVVKTDITTGRRGTGGLQGWR